MKEQLIAITVSVNYTDVLPLVLETNYKFFKHWYIVTEKSDIETQKLCSKYLNVEVLFFDFQGEIVDHCRCCGHGTIRQSKFNKGGALRMAQRIANKRFHNDFKLILDSDICLPPIFLDAVKNKKLEEEVIYGAPRWLYESVEDYKYKPLKRKLENEWVVKGMVIGFFQLYKSNFLYEDSVSCEYTDINFSDKFKRKDFINLIMNHIGETKKHWNGK